MKNNKSQKIRIQIIISSMIMMILFVTELYAMINIPKEFAIIGGIAAAMLIALYFLVNGFLMIENEKKIRREEQYENIFKSEKASYLMLKKYFEEFQDKLQILEKSAKIPTEEIVGTQKGIGKVIINRSRENAEAIISSNDELVESVESLGQKIANNNNELIDSYRSISNDGMQQLIMKQQNLLVEMKDMEIRINQAIMQSQKIISSSIPKVSYVQPQMVAPSADVPVSPEPIVEEMPVAEPEPVVEEMPVAEPEPIVEEVPVAEPELIVEEVPVTESEPVSEPEPVPESVVEEVAQEAPAIDMSDPNKKMSPEEIEAMFAAMSSEPAKPAAEPEAISEPEPIPEPEPVPEPVVEEAPQEAPAIDMSDPNKQLSADEIAALFSSMSQDVVASDPEPVPETVEEPKEEPVPASAIDTSDPNKQLSPDEIAALFASMTS